MSLNYKSMTLLASSRCPIFYSCNKAIYSSTTDEYRSMDYLPMSYGGMSLLQLDDAVASSIPSAVIYFKGSVAQAR